MKAKEKTFRETMLALEAHRHIQATIPLETPGPHRLQAKTPRPEDLLYQQKLQQQETAENELAQHNNASNTHSDPNQHLVDVFKQLTRVMKDNNTSDDTDPVQFNGSDEKWDEFYAQLRWSPWQVLYSDFRRYLATKARVC
jgi:hypothetical protein